MFPEPLIEFRALGLAWRLGWQHVVAVVGSYAAIRLALRRPGDREILSGELVPVTMVIIAAGGFVSFASKGLLYGRSGSHFFGWAWGAALGLRVYTWCRRRALAPLLDVLLPPTLLACATLRLGCLLAGCCHGRPCRGTGCLWMPGALEGPDFYFPTQLVDAATHALAFVLAYFVIARRCPRTGRVACFAAAAYAAGRLCVGFLRMEPRGWLGLTIPQWSALFTLLLTLWIFFALQRADLRPPSHPRAEEGAPCSST